MGQAWDVIDIHEEPFALAAAEILFLRRIRRQRAPYTLYSAQNLEKRYPVPFRWLERWSLRHASGISVCNRDAGRIVKRKGFPGEPSIIPLGVDPVHLPTLAQRRAPVRSPVPSRSATSVVLHRTRGWTCCSTLSPSKIACVLHCAGRRSGGGTDWRARRETLGVTDRVDFLGPIQYDELRGVLPAHRRVGSTVAALPGWVEQFGRVAVEAMACGVPVVASATGALPEVVGEGGLLVPAGGSGGAREALLELTTEPNRRRQVTTAAVAAARACTWDAGGRELPPDVSARPALAGWRGRGATGRGHRGCLRRSAPARAGVAPLTQPPDHRGRQLLRCRRAGGVRRLGGPISRPWAQRRVRRRCERRPADAPVPRGRRTSPEPGCRDHAGGSGPAAACPSCRSRPRQCRTRAGRR